jgi:uncharacterized repeat protein (TIGR02543 family)
VGESKELAANSCRGIPFNSRCGERLFSIGTAIYEPLEEYIYEYDASLALYAKWRQDADNTSLNDTLLEAVNLGDENNGKYTEASWVALQTAMNNAFIVNELIYVLDDTYSRQTDIDRATADLRVALSGLTLVPSTFALTLNANGGTVTPTSVTQATGTTYSLPTPTRSNYTFTGWTLSGGGTLSGNTYTFGTSNGTVTAQWTTNPSNYTVTYNTDGGTPTIAPVTVDSGTSITLPAAPTKSRAIFKGWSNGSTTLAAGATYIVNGNVTFTAQWAKTIFSTKYEATFLNWILFFVCFGFIWMWF